MKITTRTLAAGALWLLFVVHGYAQCPNGASTCVAHVPRLVKYSGTLKDSTGNPLTGVVGMTFSVYSDSTGGAPLWQEVQNVQLDCAGTLHRPAGNQHQRRHSGGLIFFRGIALPGRASGSVGRDGKTKSVDGERALRSEGWRC